MQRKVKLEPKQCKTRVELAPAVLISVLGRSLIAVHRIGAAERAFSRPSFSLYTVALALHTPVVNNSNDRLGFRAKILVDTI
jgi:hypothetical protein